MKHISLGGLDVSRIGLGAMAMSGYYLDPDSSDAESIRTIQRALELGITHIDTAEIYGPYANEELVGRALKGRRDDVVVATKFGLVSHSGGGPGVLDSSPANIRAAVEGSLKRLGTDRIDLYYQHRVDPNTPSPQGPASYPCRIGTGLWESAPCLPEPLPRWALWPAARARAVCCGWRCRARYRDRRSAPAPPATATRDGRTARAPAREPGGRGWPRCEPPWRAPVRQ